MPAVNVDAGVAVRQRAQKVAGQRDPEAHAAARAELAAHLAAQADDAEGWFLLALLEQRSGEASVALPYAHKAAQLDRSIPKYALLLGDLLLTQGRTRDASLAYQSALAITPTDHNTLRKLGECFLADGDFDQATAALRAALSHKPTHAGAWFSLGQALHQQGFLGEASSALHRVLSRQPRNGGAYVELGRIAMAQARLEEADRCFRCALNLNVPMVANRIAVGHLYARMADEEQAAAAYRSALEHHPDHPEALEGLAFLLRGELPATERSRLAALINNPTLSAAERARMHYSEVECLTGDGDLEERVRHAHAASLLQKQAWAAAGRPHSVPAHRRYVTQMIETFDAEYFEAHGGFGSSSQRPVFVVGMPRSGTSLVEQILSSHPDVFGAGELLHIGTGLEALRRRIAPQGSFGDAARTADRNDVQQVALDYQHKLSELDAVSSRVTDKLPLNFLNVGWIHTLFPHATILHCQRDPRDVAISCYFKGLARVRWSADIAEITEYIRDYHRLMRHWEQVLPGRVIPVQYERLVADLEGEARQLIEHIGQEWSERCLAFHENRRSVCTASVAQVRNEVYTTSVERWRQYEDLLGPHLETLSEFAASHEPQATNRL